MLAERIPVRLSLRQAVNQHCKDCIYDSRDKGSWREQIKNCTSPKCALFDVRPVPRKVGA